MVTNSETDQADTDTPQVRDTWRETQWMRSNLSTMLYVGALAVMSWVLLVLEIVPDRFTGLNLDLGCGVWVVCFLAGVASPLIFWHMRLIVEVSSDAVLIRYVPLVQRTIPLVEIKGVQVRPYPNYQHYFGSIFRFSILKHEIYGLNSAQCVRFELENGLTVTVGSRRADELASAITSRQV